MLGLRKYSTVPGYNALSLPHPSVSGRWKQWCHQFPASRKTHVHRLLSPGMMADVYDFHVLIRSAEEQIQQNIKTFSHIFSGLIH